MHLNIFDVRTGHNHNFNVEMEILNVKHTTFHARLTLFILAYIKSIHLHNQNKS